MTFLCEDFSLLWIPSGEEYTQSLFHSWCQPLDLDYDASFTHHCFWVINANVNTAKKKAKMSQCFESSFYFTDSLEGFQEPPGFMDHFKNHYCRIFNIQIYIIIDVPSLLLMDTCIVPRLFIYWIVLTSTE